MPEYLATFLLPIRRRGGVQNIGAAVNDRAQVVILAVPEDLPLSMHEATEFAKKIRAAVLDASLRQY